VQSKANEIELNLTAGP